MQIASRTRTIALTLSAACTSEPMSTTEQTTTNKCDAPVHTPTRSTSTRGAIPEGAMSRSVDFLEMDACNAMPVCQPFFHLFGEGAPYHSDGADITEQEVCIFSGLRDRTPGRYSYGTQDKLLSGTLTTEYIIHLHADCAVTVAGRMADSLGGLVYFPAKTCNLSSSDFFDSCTLDTDLATHLTCISPDNWWHDCSEEGPKCG